MKKKILVAFGTRPEAIKMAPVIKELNLSNGFEAITCVTAQHRDLLDQVTNFFKIKAEKDLNLMKPGQDLFDITTACLTGMREIFKEIAPDVVLVQGDTTTTFSVALAAAYQRIPVGHIEAGLRTWNKASPFPEEVNRCCVTQIAQYHFAPTRQSVNNLLREGIDPNAVFQTGNTSIDALKWATHICQPDPEIKRLYEGKKLVLMTAHRRENFGQPMRSIFPAVRRFAYSQPDVHILYPVHPNPNVCELAKEFFTEVPNISLVKPLDYSQLVAVLKDCHFVMTDSGGLQEEAPTLGKPVVVFRETTERPEAVEAGCAVLVGHDERKIQNILNQLAQDNSQVYEKMAKAVNPFGTGHAARKIVQILAQQLFGEKDVPWFQQEVRA